MGCETSAAVPGQRNTLYLLKDVFVERRNQVWCRDIAYTPLRCGFQYLVPVMDCYNRQVISWLLSNSTDVGFCLEAPDEGFDHGTPEVFAHGPAC